MARVLVTGAAGFIGSHVSEALLGRGDEVVGIDDFNEFYDPAIKEQNAREVGRADGFTLVRGSLLDPATLEQAFAGAPFDTVVHLAAWAGVRPSIERPALYQRQNIEATVALMERMRLAGEAGELPELVFASSSSVYGENEKVPFSETDPVEHPISPYAATKRSCELLTHTYHHLFGLQVSCLRFFTVYGPRQRPDLAIHKFARLLADGRPIPMYGDGSTSRDYTFIDDTVAGVLAAIDRTSGWRLFNLGNSATVTLKELIEKIGRAVGVEPTVEQLPEQPGDVPRTWADISRARAELGYDPKTSIDDGLAVFAEWFQAQR
jgi:UDP-glucuronate 4-epimerase